MEKTLERLIFGAVMLAAVFFISAFLFPAGAQVVDVDNYETMKQLLEGGAGSSELKIHITKNMDITGQIEVHSSIKTLDIDGIKSGDETYTLDGGGSYSFLKVGSIDLTLRNITIEDCNGSDGAVIYADQPNTKITLKDSVFSSNIAEIGSGGVVYQEGGTGESPAESNTLTIEHCTFTANGNEWFHGGVIYQRQYAQLKVSNSSFTYNFSEEDGGAISQGDDCRMVIENTKFEGNSANYAEGGAVFQDERCSLEISGSEFSGNTAYYQGGAVYQGDFSKLTVTGSVFSGNEADERGGAICQKKGAVMTVKDCQFLENKSDIGGAVYAPTNAEVTGTGSETCLFSGNKADFFGGALEYGQDLTVTSCTFRENESYYGGALASPWDRLFLNQNEEDESYYFTQEGLVGTVVISDSHFIENTADYGGVWYDSAGFEEEMFGEDTYVYYDEEKGKYYYLTQDELLPVIVVNPDGSETRYGEAGSKIYFDEACGSKITVSGTEFIDNTANVHGGALFLNNLQTTKIKEDNVFSGNSATGGKGGVIYNIGEGELTVSGSEFTKNSAGVTDAICYSDENGIVSFEDNTFTGNTVESDDGWVFALGGNTTIKNNDFFANTDTKRDMLFKDASKDDEISGNTYRGNFLEDAFSSPDPDTEIEWSPEIGVTLDLRKVYNDEVRDGAVRISINGSTYKDFDVTDGKAVIKIGQSDLNDGVNNIKAEYISGEYTDEDEYTEGDGYYHYQQPELNFTITKYTVTVTTDGNGTASADPASGTTGTEAALTAEPNEGFKFKEWVVTESGGGTLNGDTFAIGTDNAEIEALFEAIVYQVTITTDGNGTASADPASGTIGTKVKLTANPAEEYKFKEWNVIESGGGTLDGDTFTIRAGDAEIEAVFEEIEYQVTVTAVGNGTASADPASGPKGTDAALTAQPDNGWEFKEWNVIESGGGTLNGDTFTIGTGNAEIEAVFEEIEYQITVTAIGNGTASADPASGPTGTEVILTAQPDDGWEFKEWNVIESGGGTLQEQKAAGASETAVFIIGTADAEIEAVFEEIEYQSVVTAVGDGTVNADPASGPTGTKIRLTAIAKPGWRFKEWKVIDAGGGTLDGDIFTIGTGNAVIEAVFEEIVYQSVVTAVGDGTVNADPASGPTGTEIRLTAIAKPGWRFKGWKVIDAGGGTLDGDIFTIGTGNAVIEAVFEEIPEEYQVTVTTDGNGTAIADPVSGPTGTEVMLTAEPNDGYTFREWNVIESGGGTLNGNTFTIGTGDAVIEAVFEKSVRPQPPLPPMPGPGLPCSELPQTGITGAGISLKDKPASLNYAPIGMELYIPVLNVTTDIVTVPLADDSYPVQWLGKDAGLLEGFAKPGSGISVIAGHNTLNAEEYGPFALLNTLNAGDVLFVRRSNGELLRFTVYLNEKISAGDIEGLQRAAGMYDNTLTLLTCEDELAEGGYASRRIISAR